MEGLLKYPTGVRRTWHLTKIHTMDVLVFLSYGVPMNYSRGVAVAFTKSFRVRRVAANLGFLSVARFKQPFMTLNIRLYIIRMDWKDSVGGAACTRAESDDHANEGREFQRRLWEVMSRTWRALEKEQYLVGRKCTSKELKDISQ